MPKGYAIHIGINDVDHDLHTRRVGSVPSPLDGCTEDARMLAEITQSQGFTEVTLLLNEEATIENWLETWHEMLQKIEKEDLLVISFSGHGGQVSDVMAPLDEEDYGTDKKDEFWCMYNNIMLDDAFFVQLTELPAGLRFLLISDSCHGGGMDRLNEDILLRPYERFDPNMKEKFLKFDQLKIQASGIVWAAAREEQVARAGHLAFTPLLVETYRLFPKGISHDRFFQRLHSRSSGKFKPHKSYIGAPNPAFNSSNPFTI